MPAETWLREAAVGDGQREGALHLLAGPDATRADDAFRGIEGEIGVRGILRLAEMVLAVIAVADLAQAHCSRHVLQLAVAVRRAGQAVERMVGDVELHHALADRFEALRLRPDDEALGDRRGAGGRRAGPALDLDEAEPARAEAVEHVGRAELGDLRFPSPSPPA